MYVSLGFTFSASPITILNFSAVGIIGTFLYTIIAFVVTIQFATYVIRKMKYFFISHSPSTGETPSTFVQILLNRISFFGNILLISGVSSLVEVSFGFSN